MLAYWAGTDVGVVEFDASDDDHPEIVVTVEVDGRPIKPLLDSGASGSILDKAEAARLGVTPNTPGVVAAQARGGIGSNSISSWVGGPSSNPRGSGSSRTSEQSTAAPSRANRSAIARPLPDDDPVIHATCPVSLIT